MRKMYNILVFCYKYVINRKSLNIIENCLFSLEIGGEIMLTENEWNTINNMLLELYTIDELDVFTSKIMKMIRMLIPYTKGWFIILDDDRKIRKEQSYFIGFDTDVKDKYIN